MNTEILTIILDILSIVFILISAFIAARGRTFDDKRKKNFFKKIRRAGWYFIIIFILGNSLQYISNSIKSNAEIKMQQEHKDELLSKHEKTVNLELEIAENNNKSFHELDSINNQLRQDNDTLKSELKHLRAEYVAVLKDYNNSLKDKKQNLYTNFQSEIRKNRTSLISTVPKLSYSPRFIPDHDLTIDASKSVLTIINNQHFNRYVMLYIEHIDDVIKYINNAAQAQKRKDSIGFNNLVEGIKFNTRQIHKQEDVFECSFESISDVNEFSISEKFLLIYNDTSQVGTPISGYCDENLYNFYKKLYQN